MKMATVEQGSKLLGLNGGSPANRQVVGSSPTGVAILLLWFGCFELPSGHLFHSRLQVLVAKVEIVRAISP